MMTVDPRTLTRFLDAPGPREGNCPTSDTLARAASPDADLRVRGELADHLLVCRPCSEEFRIAQEVAAWAETTATSESAFDNADAHVRLHTRMRPRFDGWMY